MSVLPDGVRRMEFGDDEQLATRGPPVGDEPTAGEWRAWEPTRSKLAATYAVGLDPGFAADDTVLYLGAANGTTVSHVADVAGRTYAVEFAPRPVRDLLRVAADRPNLFPLLKDARQPETYGHVVERGVDCLIQDVATRGQAAVAVANSRFLKPDGRLIAAIKARSEDVAADPTDTFAAARDRLSDAYEIRATRRLDGYHDAHLAVVAEPNESNRKG